MFPYQQLTPQQSWSLENLDHWQGSRHSFLDKSTPLMSAGSCFARHLAQGLQNFGFHYVVTEPGPPWFNTEDKVKHHYGTYSARYGNIYSSLQFLQLVQRAYGDFKPQEPAWKGFGGLVDPFRPTVQHNGFQSAQEMETDRQQHLQAVRSAFKQSQVLLLTLGLTEIWQCTPDGAVLPMCPGKQVGEFDPERYRWHDLSIQENIDYLHTALSLLREKNPELKVILSVSPVPLAATMKPQHILISTLESKSVLRVSAQEICKALDGVYYFPSYDFLQHAFVDTSRFDLAKRQLKAEHLQRVMRLFFEMFYTGDVSELSPRVPLDQPEAWNNEPCDEELLLKSIKADFDGV